MSRAPDRLPETDPERVADAIALLADTIESDDLRAQLHAMAGIVRGLVVPPPGGAVTSAHARLLRAEKDKDDDALVEALEAVARAEGARVGRVDWMAASGG